VGVCVCVDRRGYYIEDINVALDKHASCEDENSTVSHQEQQKVIDELERLTLVVTRSSLCSTNV